MAINVMSDAECGDNKISKTSDSKTSEAKDITLTENVVSSSPSSLASWPWSKTDTEIKKNKKKLGYLLLLEQTKKTLEKIYKDITKLEKKSFELQQELTYYQKKYDARSMYYDKYLLESEEKMSYFHTKAEFYGVEDIDIVTNNDAQQAFLEKLPENIRESQAQVLVYLYSLFIEPLNKKNAADYAEAIMQEYTKKIDHISSQYIKNEQKIEALEVKYADIQIDGTLDAHLSAWQDVSLDDLVASDDVIHQIKKIITMYKNPIYFTDCGIALPKSILFSGSSDTGKTFAAKLLASEIGRKMYHIKAHDLFSEENLDPNAMLYFLFSSIIEKTQETKEPCIIFLDEIEKIIDSMWEYASANQMAITNTIIKNITNIQKSDLDIIILAALVKKNIIDPKLLKYDLFPKQIFFSSMKDEERKNLFTLVFKDSSNDIVQFSPDINMDELIKKTNGFSPEYIKKLVAVAIEDATYALFSDQKKKSVPVIVTQKHLLKNIELLKEESKTKWDTKYLRGK